jgi:hypothetical protein
MWKKNYSRREFVKKNSLTGIGALVAMGVAPSVFAGMGKTSDVPAILGGDPVRTKPWPDWPVWDAAADEKQVLEVLRSGVWCRVGVEKSVVTDFEEKWAQILGARRCLAVVNGTNALIISPCRISGAMKFPHLILCCHHFSHPVSAMPVC